MIAFECACGRRLKVRDSLGGEFVRCPACRESVYVPEVELEEALLDSDEPEASESLGLKALFGACIAAGFAIAFVIYFILFDDLDETTLVRLTPAWVFPLAFGIYGFVAEKLKRLLAAGRADSLSGAVRIWASATGFVGLILLFPFLFVKTKSSLVVSLVASLFWAVLLVIFFEAIFPLL